MALGRRSDALKQSRQEQMEANPASPASRTIRIDQIRREIGLDETLAETFPCSDPLSSIPNPLEASSTTRKDSL
jgi:hypothetical protein